MYLSTTTKTSDIFKILSDPTRLKIISLLLENAEGMCVYEIADSIGMSQSATSHQLAKLEARGLVKCFRDGQMICYEMRKSVLTEKIKKVLNTF